MKAEQDWYLGFSGGKDSTALLILVLNAIRAHYNPKCYIHIVYCDTGVEFPQISSMVYDLFESLRKEITFIRRDIIFEVVKPALSDRYFSMVIGNGYVPPTFLFRWCTRRLRIKPIQDNIYSHHNSLVLLGIREGESSTRDGVIKTHRLSEYYTKQAGAASTVIFCPIIHFSTAEVWEAINLSYPININRDFLRKLYSCIGSVFDKDIFVSDNNNGRYGCWVCTVIRKDKAMEGLISNDHENLKPLQEFIEWMRCIRNDEDRRMPNRMTGVIGKGPLNLETRKEILERLLEIQDKSNYCLISNEEIDYIRDVWDKS